ncbi:agmatine/peptidylarginine deiminase [Pontibacterium sp.]|uniref:agmatine deiminase family protein n=3 Tax=Pontibacterium sp. TaxID=2036026 RepID=UPI003516E0B8
MMLSRRRMLTRALSLASAGVLLPRLGIAAMGQGKQAFHMPDENAPHTRTWMAFGASRKIWGRELLPDVRRDLATIAKTIARYEPVTMLVREREYDIARSLVGDTVDLHVAEMDDLWMRDTGPVFVINGKGEKAAVDLNFNGWGEKQDYDLDAEVAEEVAQAAGVKLLRTELVLEGGCIEVDGEGTAIIAESCVLNDNRNPGWSKAEVEAELKHLLGLQKIIWIPGVRGMDITDGHTDFYARFARPGVVVAGYDPDPESPDHKVTERHLEILEAAIDAQGRKLKVLVLEGPTDIRSKFYHEEFAAGYIGFYVCNSAVLMQKFGDRRADRKAEETLRKAFPKHDVIALSVDALAAGGGSIHCSTQQEPIA